MITDYNVNTHIHNDYYGTHIGELIYMSLCILQSELKCIYDTREVYCKRKKVLKKSIVKCDIQIPKVCNKSDFTQTGGSSNFFYVGR